MDMQFPRLERIEDVQDAVARADEAFTWRRTHARLLTLSYSVIATRSHFDDPIAREFRGLSFDADTGAVASRPLHKFFNWQEQPEADAAVDWSAPHRVLEKLDGSMIHLAELSDGTILWCTKGGVTAVARHAQKTIPDAMRRACEHLVRAADGAALTPVYEFTGPTNRIVLPYERHALRLLCVRERLSGRYLSDAEITALLDASEAAAGVRVEVCPGLDGAPVRWGGAALDARIADVRARGADSEGVVVAWDNGHRIKVKAERYVTMHHCVSGLLDETVVLRTVLHNAHDDWAGLLPQDDFAEVERYAAQVEDAVRRNAALLRETALAISEACGDDQKRFAADWMAAAPNKILQAVGFNVRKHHVRGGTVDNAWLCGQVREAILKKSRRRIQITEQSRPAFGLPTWRWARLQAE